MLEDFFPPDKLIWVGVAVDKLEPPYAVTEQVHEYSVKYDPEHNSGVIIAVEASSLDPDTEEPERDWIFVIKEMVPGLIAALKKYQEI